MSKRKTFSWLALITALALTSGQAQDYPLKLTLSAKKTTFRTGEKIEFEIVCRNVAAAPIAVLVRGYDWEGVDRLDAAYRKRQALAREDPRHSALATYPNLAVEIRARGNPRPLGRLELVQEKEPVRAGQPPSVVPSLIFDDDGLFCGTGLKKGMMPGGLSTRHTIVIGPEVRLGPPGVYRFRWHAESPDYPHSRGTLKFAGQSNIVALTIVE